MSLAIQFDKVGKTYNGASKPAVKGLSFQINDGEIVGLLGPNGAGKSTSVMMLCGLIKNDEGTITVLGKNTSTESSVIRKMIGVATQEIALFPTLTAKENLEYLGNMYGLSGKKLQQKIDFLLKAFALENKKNERVESFSGGMKRRLNLIAALLHEPKLLILDEPTAGVDVQSRNLIIEFLKDLNKQGVTILYSSHLMEEAEKLCTRFGIIDEGKLIASGTREELLQQNESCKNLEELFLHLTGKSVRE
jgi:ABC-2 type transport system ATP-binding protein